VNGASAVDAAASGGFHHQACFYAGDDAFLAAAVPFVAAGVGTGDAVLVAVGPERTEALRDHLGRDADRVRFADMRVLGRNPARIIPAWGDFLDAGRRAGRGVRGIGEPIWPGRAEAEVEECHLHEALLNVAFDGGPGWSLLCPYDAGLGAEVLRRAEQPHRHLSCPGSADEPGGYAGPVDPFATPLGPAPVHAAALEVGVVPLRAVRGFVTEHAGRAGLDAERTRDLVSAVCELAANTARHGAGRGLLRIWRDHRSVICDVEDPGRGARFEPLVGRRRPGPDQLGGRGLWMVNQLCDLVQIRTADRRTTVRVHLHLA
jgi:anti-sigma regulatory factor (Ser/Thr protein kinase)